MIEVNRYKDTFRLYYIFTNNKMSWELVKLNWREKMAQEITVDFSEQIAKTQTKIDRLQKLIHDIENQKYALENYKKNDVLSTDKVRLLLRGLSTCPINISVETLIPLLEQNIEDNTALIHELAKELGIDIK